MNDNIVLRKFTLGLAILDCLPVLFFGISIYLLGMIFGSPLIFLGGMLCFLAGTGKVLWKMLIVIKKKNIQWLSIQMRFMMPIGFLLIIIGIIIHRQDPIMKTIVQWISEMPVIFFLSVGLLSFVLLGLFAMNLNNTDARNHWIEEIINTIGQFFLLIAMILLAYASNFYYADNSASKALLSTSSIEITCKENLASFEPLGPKNNGLVFYPGANVEFTAYAPLMKKLAEKGVSCYLVRMPLNLAFFDSDQIEEVMDAHPEIENWYLAGHSLGGVAGSWYARNNGDKIQGLILLASYSINSLDGINLLTVYGNLDGIIEEETYEKTKAKYPANYLERIIQGGNHAQFGSYGKQIGDEDAIISAEEQWQITADTIFDFISNNQ